MGRGSSEEVVADYNLIAKRGGDVRGTALGEALDELASFELDEREEAALRGLTSLALTYPEAPGFDRSAICKLAAGFSKRPGETFLFEEADDLIAALEEKGLAERTSNSLDIETSETTDEPGWKIKPAGIQICGALAMNPA